MLERASATLSLRLFIVCVCMRVGVGGFARKNWGEIKMVYLAFVYIYITVNAVCEKRTKRTKRDWCI